MPSSGSGSLSAQVDTPYWSPLDSDLSKQALEDLHAHLLGAVDAIERLLGRSPRTAEIRNAYRANRPGAWRGNGWTENAT